MGLSLRGLIGHDINLKPIGRDLLGNTSRRFCAAKTSVLRRVDGLDGYFAFSKYSDLSKSRLVYDASPAYGETPVSAGLRFPTSRRLLVVWVPGT